MDNELVKFSERLVDKLIEKEVKQKDLSIMLGTTQQTISRWIKGINEPNLTDLIRICFLLDEDPNYMLGFDELDETVFISYEAQRLEEYQERMENFEPPEEDPEDIDYDFANLCTKVHHRIQAFKNRKKQQ